MAKARTLRDAPGFFIMYIGEGGGASIAHTGNDKELKMVWKIYFIVLAVISIPGYASQGLHRFWEIFDLFYFIGAMIGYFGFCWNKRIGTEIFWKLYFWSSLLWNLLYQYVFPILPQYEILRNGKSGILLSTINLIIFLPMMVGLYKYAYNQSTIWAKNKSI